MSEEKITLVQILNTINKFNESVAKSFHKWDYANFHLGYCIPYDTLNSFYDKGRCFNHSGFQEPYIEIDATDFRKFKKHFGRGFAYKLIDIIDNWKKENNFPYKHNETINSLPEHSKLIKLFSIWKNMSEEEKFNDILDIDGLQKQIYEKSNELENLSKNLE